MSVAFRHGVACGRKFGPCCASGLHGAAIMAFLRKALAGAAAAWLAATGVGAAQNIDAVTAEELEAALAAAGFAPTELSDAATGDPVFHVTAGEFTFVVRALSCSGRPRACQDLMFFANFDLGRPATADDFRVVDDFRDGQVFGRAYVLEEKAQVGVDYVIELGGGVSPDHLAQNISRWADVMTAFVEDFREGHKGS